MIHWRTSHYNELSKDLFHDIIALRIEVFIIEQNCPYQELDGKDKQSHHVYGIKDNVVIASTRIVPPGESYKEVSIGRVVTKESERGTGLGRELMLKSMAFVETIYGKVPIKISAQQHLSSFYNSLGFEQVTEMYLEDDIPHIGMKYMPD